MYDNEQGDVLMDWILSFVKNICIFTLVMTLVLNLFPESNYRKYIKLFAGFLLLILVLQPILKIKNIDLDIEKIVQDINYENSIQINKKEREIESVIRKRMDGETTAEESVIRERMDGETTIEE